MSDAINPNHYKRLPAEAIDIIESAIAGAHSVQAGYLQGQALKYLLRLNHKGCQITDAKKAKWYLDRLIQTIEATEPDSVVNEKLIADSEQPTEPPYGCRFLQRGELIRKGDMLLRKGLIHDIEPKMLGKSCYKEWMPVIRRNKFEVGEKVVEFFNNRIGVVKDIEAIGNGKSFLYHVEMQDTKGTIVFSPHQIAPYIEETE